MTRAIPQIPKVKVQVMSAWEDRQQLPARGICCAPVKVLPQPRELGTPQCNKTACRTPIYVGAVADDVEKAHDGPNAFQEHGSALYHESSAPTAATAAVVPIVEDVSVCSYENDNDSCFSACLARNELYDGPVDYSFLPADYWDDDVDDDDDIGFFHSGDNLVQDEDNVNDNDDTRYYGDVEDDASEGSSSSYYSCHSHAEAFVQPWVADEINSRKRKRVDKLDFSGMVLSSRLDDAKRQLRENSEGLANEYVLVGRVAFGPYTSEEAVAARNLLRIEQTHQQT